MHLSLSQSWKHNWGIHSGNCVTSVLFAYRPSVHGCLTGIAGLQAAEAAQLQPDQNARLVKALLEVQITSLPQADRMMALAILSRALQVIRQYFSCAWSCGCRQVALKKTACAWT